MSSPSQPIESDMDIITKLSRAEARITLHNMQWLNARISILYAELSADERGEWAQCMWDATAAALGVLSDLGEDTGGEVEQA